MTGPGPGKVPVKSNVYLNTPRGLVRVEPCEVYIHVKGYSRARVTHVDIESPVIDELEPRTNMYARIYRVLGGFRVVFRSPLRYRGCVVNGLIVKWEGPEVLKPGESSVVFIGFKMGGLYIGFKKNIILILEEYARKAGIPT